MPFPSLFLERFTKFWRTYKRFVPFRIISFLSFHFFAIYSSFSLANMDAYTDKEREAKGQLNGIVRLYEDENKTSTFLFSSFFLSRQESRGKSQSCTLRICLDPSMYIPLPHKTLHTVNRTLNHLSDIVNNLLPGWALKVYLCTGRSPWQTCTLVVFVRIPKNWTAAFDPCWIFKQVCRR